MNRHNISSSNICCGLDPSQFLLSLGNENEFGNFTACFSCEGFFLLLRKGEGVIIIKCIENIQQIKVSIKPIFDRV
jgi:hypothetical protein